jgi:bifunctional DNA primase/polymerase-like protein/primase-like protein
VTSYPPLCRLPLAAGSKRPLLVRWSTIDPADDIIAKVFADNPHCGVGLRLDGLAVIDCDSPERVAWWLDQGFLTEYMSRGNPERRSFWYRLPEDVEIRTVEFLDWEIRSGATHQCVIPPSIHPGGWRYEWLGPAVTQETFFDLPEAPVDFLTDVLHRSSPADSGIHENWSVILEGEGRDNRFTSLCGFLHRYWRIHPDANRQILAAVNQLICEPPLSGKDLDRIARSVSRYKDEVTYTFEETE